MTHSHTPVPVPQLLGEPPQQLPAVLQLTLPARMGVRIQVFVGAVIGETGVFRALPQQLPQQLQQAHEDRRAWACAT